MVRIKTAVVGVGQLGRHHARWYKNIKDSELVGVYDIDSHKARQAADEWDVRSFDNIEAMMGQVEAVSIAVPTGAHFKVASKFLEHGIHCLMEKPIAATVEEAAELIKLAEQKKVVFSVGHIERFNPAITALKSYDIRPRFIEAHRLSAFDPRGTDVPVILDLMIHDIDLVLYLVGSKVKGIESSAVPVISDTADIANARLTFDNGAVANLTASRISLRPMRKLRIFQKSGYFSLDLAEKQADIYRLADSSKPHEAGMRIPLGKSGHEIIYNKAGSKDNDMLCLELTDFLKAVQTGSMPEVTARAAMEALRVAAEIERIGAGGVVT